MKIWAILLLGIFSIAASNSINRNWTIPSPPKGNEAKDAYLYNSVLHNHFNQIQVVSANPNGNNTAEYGSMLIYKATGSIYYFTVQVTSPNGTNWLGTKLDGF